MQACEFTGIGAGRQHAPEEKKTKTARQIEEEGLGREVVIPYESVLPPDMDSNQTLTASRRADVWAGATFKPDDNNEG